MLTAFKDELKRLSVDPDDPFYEKIKKKVGKRATQILILRLKGLILVMPGLIRRIHALWNVSPAGSEIKKLGGFILTYLYQPKDFLAEDVHGLFGYLDDAYLVLVVYEKVVEAAGSAGVRMEPDDHEYLKQIHSSRRYVKAVIPEEAKKIELMVEKAVRSGEFEPFAQAFGPAV